MLPVQRNDGDANEHERASNHDELDCAHVGRHLTPDLIDAGPMTQSVKAELRRPSGVG
jgi:hypothetical protein